MSTDISGPTTVLVAGGAGFIGSHLCRHLLSKNHQVICLDNYATGTRMPSTESGQLLLVDHDIVDPLPRFDVPITAIYHLASPASPVAYQRDPIGTLRANSEGTFRLLTAAQAHNARLLLASTSEVYGDPLVHPQVETYNGNVSPTGPRSMYDEGKRFAEAMTTAFAGIACVQTRIARIFNTYGPGMRADDGRVVSNFIVQILRGEPVTIYGNGHQTRSFQYVSDVVEGLVRLMASDFAGPVNLGNPEEISMIDLASRIARLANRDLHIDWRPASNGDPQRRRPDITLAFKTLGWKPEIRVEDGLRRTIDWFASTQSDDTRCETDSTISQP
jgi:nucleoside-diphosphate-sugar epimerase